MKRCILLLADGARPDVFRQLLQEGRLPAIEKHLLKNGVFRSAVATFPSTTGPAYLPFLTGCYAGTCNLPGIRWFDRKKYAQGGLPFRSFRSYVGIESILMNRDINPQIRSLFQIIPNSVNIYNAINKGSPFRWNKTKFSRIFYAYYAHLTDRWSVIDKASRRKLISALKTHPDLQFAFAVFPAIDEFSHIGDPFHPLTLKAYEGIDQIVGEVFRVLTRRGWQDETIVGIVSDHGLSSTHTHLPLNQFMEGEGFKVFYYPLILKRRFSVANMVSGNGMAHLYLKGRRGWGEPIFEEELLSYKGGLFQKLLNRPEIDIIACRNQKGEVVVTSRRGKARLWREDGGIGYQVDAKESDPFGYPALPLKMMEDEALTRTFATDYPDALVQLLQIFRSERSGDLVLSASKGCDLRKRHEIPEHKSSHGSLIAEHMLTPMILNFPIQKKEVRTVDLFPTILKLLGKKIPTPIDGNSLV
ncbi:MAG: alkaline phosphatase family protein [Deltaproteobacteria bacterium]|nr:alkaline phosphatase family protein [Deltaproteobacteria bacterium]